MVEINPIKIPGRWSNGYTLDLHRPTRQVAANSSRRDFDFYATKDIQMAQEASVGLMIWDGESAGTLMNVWRLIKQNKKAVILEVTKRASHELNSESEWKDFFSAHSDEVRQRIERLSASESKVTEPVQTSLL
jgi:hypothetical protein